MTEIREGTELSHSSTAGYVIGQGTKRLWSNRIHPTAQHAEERIAELAHDLTVEVRWQVFALIPVALLDGTP